MQRVVHPSIKFRAIFVVAYTVLFALTVIYRIVSIYSNIQVIVYPNNNIRSHKELSALTTR